MTDPVIVAQPGRQSVGLFVVLLSTIIWATAGLFVRLLPFDIWSIIVWRNLFAVFFVGAYVFSRLGWGTFEKIRMLGWPGWLAAFCSTVTIIMFPAAFQHASVGNVVTIYAALPFVTAAIAWAWFRETPSVPTLLASLLAIIGIVIMVGPSAGGPQLGDVLAFASTVAMALLTLIVRRHSTIEMLPVVLISIILSGFIALPLAGHLGDFAARDLLVAAGFGLFPLTLGLMLYVIGSAMIPSTTAALIQTLEAPFGVLWAWIGVAEVPVTTTLIGGGLVILGVFGRLLFDLAVARRNLAT